MTISSTTNKIQYTGNGVTTSFSFPHVFFSTADLLVTLYNTSTEADVSPAPVLNGAATYDYVITGTFDAATGEYLSGGDVVFNTAPPSTFRVTIERIVSPTQLVDLIDGSRFPASTVNGELDKLTVLIQRAYQLLAQALSYPSSDPSTVTNIIPDAATRASKFLAFDGNGNPIVDVGPVIETDTRIKLTSAGTRYIRTDGSDSNTGLANTAGAAFRTMQGAYDATFSTIDLDGNNLTFQMAAGTYTVGLIAQGSFMGQTESSVVSFIGDEVTPANVIVSCTSNSCLAMTRCDLTVAGIQWQTTTGGFAWIADYHSTLLHRNNRMGAVVSDQILANHHSLVKATGRLDVAGNADTFIHSTARSRIEFDNQIVNFIGTRTFTTYLCGINDASVSFAGSTILKDSASTASVNPASGGMTIHIRGMLNLSSITGTFFGGITEILDDGGIILRGDQATTYVRTDGNDQNNGLTNTAAGAFLTINAAILALQKRQMNPLWANPIIRVGAGTYAAIALRDLTDARYFVTMIGDETTPANVIISSASNCIDSSASVHTRWDIRGFKLTSSGASCITTASGGGPVFLQNVDFGAASSAHIVVGFGCRVEATGNYTISGAAAYHVLNQNGTYNCGTTPTITITGTPAFGTAFSRGDACSYSRWAGTTFSGSATGVRYLVNTNSVIDTNGGGANFLPGGTGGTAATGGQYV